MSTTFCAVAIEWWLKKQDKFKGARVCTRQIEDTDQFEITEWEVNGVDKPTDDQVNQILADYAAYLESIAYQEKRANEYPPVEDQLDALWKNGQAKIDMAAKIQAVKDKYPKP